MGSSSLLDIHVLEETAARVASLTKAIDRQAAHVEKLSAGAQRAARPAAAPGAGGAQLAAFRDNAAAVLQIYEHIEAAARRIYALEEPIDQGVQAVGWQEYLDVVGDAQRAHEEITMQPELQRFPQLPEAAQNVFARGQANLQRYFRRLSKGVLVPTDGLELMESYAAGTASPDLQIFPPDDVATLAKLLQSLQRFPQAQKGADQALLQLMDAFMTKSTQPALAHVRRQTLAAYTQLCEQLGAALLGVVLILFAGSHAPARQQTFQKAAESFAQRDMKLGAEKIAKESAPKAPKPQGGMPGGIPPGMPGSLPPGSMPPGSMPAGAPKGMPGAPPPGGHGPEMQAPPMPSSPGMPGSLPGMAGPGAPGGMSSPVMSGPPSAGTSPRGLARDSHGSTFAAPPAMPGGMPPPMTGTVPVGGSPWAVFETIDPRRSGEPAPAEELARRKQDALALLGLVFPGIEAQTRTAPLTSEFGVSGASIQFMQTLREITTNQRGIDIVLSEVPTRGYLPKPPPAWATKNEPTAAARANPVALYYSDTIDALYANLSQVALEQLRDPTKSGVFLLTNLVTIEHFITNSKTDTLSSLPRRTEIMDAMGDVGLAKFDKALDASFKLYLTDWSKLAPYLLDSTLTATAANAKLSAKDREVVKEKFRNFNTEFDALVERQKRYQVADPSLRQRMAQEVRKLIGPLYMRFWLKHKDGDFTKNLAKYVKYTPQQVEQAVTFG